MATAEELLTQAADSGVTPTETRSYFTVDLRSRTISIPSDIKNIGVESDDEVTRLYFKVPRFYDDVDLSEFIIRINYTNANGDGDLYEVDDLVTNDSELIFSWLVGRFAVTKQGTVSFIVCMKKFDDIGVTDKEFNTTTCSLPVLKGLETVREVVEEERDALHAVAKEAAEEALRDFNGDITKVSQLENDSGYITHSDINDIEQYFDREVLDADFTNKTLDATYQAVMLKLLTPIAVGKTVTFKVEAPDGDENQMYFNFYNGSTRIHNNAIPAVIGSRSYVYTNNCDQEITHIEPVLVTVLQQNSYTITIYDDKSIVDKIDELVDTTDLLSDNAEIVPDYYRSHVSDAISKARTNMLSAGVEGETFIFITDVHWSDNAKNSPALIGAITKELPIENVVFGGDVINSGSYNEKLAEMNDVGNRLRNVSKRLLSIYGNHDSNYMGNGAGFPNREFYTMMQKQSDYYITHSDPRWYYYFYMDNPTTKTRMIFLDTGTLNPSYAGDELSWLQRKVSEAPSNYNIIVFAHVIFSPVSGGSYYDPSTWQMTTFMTDVCNYLDTVTGKTVRAIIGGHSHYNYDTKTAGGIPIILSDCDSNQTYTGLSKTFGTTNEQSFDIITVNYKNNTIYCTKVGRGSDRTITRGES